MHYPAVRRHHCYLRTIIIAKLTFTGPTREADAEAARAAAVLAGDPAHVHVIPAEQIIRVYTGADVVTFYPASVENLFSQPIQQQMNVVVVGNSIAANGGSPNAEQFYVVSEPALANALFGSPFRFRRLSAATTRMDRNCTYGYPGQTLATINGDLQSQVWGQLATDGIVPDAILAVALQENDIVGAATMAEIKSATQEFIRSTQARYPLSIIILVAPRPSFSYRTIGSGVIRYQQLRDYYLSLDDGKSIFVVPGDINEHPTIAGVPDYFTVQASFSGTTMTVSSVPSGEVLEAGHYLEFAGRIGGSLARIVSGPSAGGPGAYTLNVSQNTTVGDIAVTVPRYTDQSVHPNAKGALRNARQWKNVISRLGNRTGIAGGPAYSNNYGLSGSGSATGTNVSGTMPTSCLFSGTANGTYVSVAENPGWLVTVSAAATNSGTAIDLGSIQLGALVAVAGKTMVRMIMSVEIVAGAENLRLLQPRTLTYDAGGSRFRYLFLEDSNRISPDWENGDVLTFVSLDSPSPNNTTLTYCDSWIKPLLKMQGGSVTFRVLRHSVVAW